MPNPNITTTYAGDVVEELMRLAVAGNETVDNGHIHIESDIMSKRNVQSLSMSSIIQDDQATPEAAGDFTITNKVLQPDNFLVFVKFNPNEFRDFWDFGQPKGQFVFAELAPEVQVAMMDEVINGQNGVAPYMGKAIWQGDKTSGTAPLDKFDGLQVKAAADADVADVTGTTLSAANIIAEIEKVYQAARVEAREHPDFKIFMPYAAWELYKQAVIALTYKGPAPMASIERMYKEKTVVPLIGMTGNKMIATVANASRQSNIWLGLTAVNDFDTIQVDKLHNYSDEYFFKMKMGADTQIKFGEDAVYYTD